MNTINLRQKVAQRAQKAKGFFLLKKDRISIAARNFTVRIRDRALALSDKIEELGRPIAGVELVSTRQKEINSLEREYKASMKKAVAAAGGMIACAAIIGADISLDALGAIGAGAAFIVAMGLTFTAAVFLLRANNAMKRLDVAKSGVPSAKDGLFVVEKN